MCVFATVVKVSLSSFNFISIFSVINDGNFFNDHQVKSYRCARATASVDE